MDPNNQYQNTPPNQPTPIPPAPIQQYPANPAISPAPRHDNVQKVILIIFVVLIAVAMIGVAYSFVKSKGKNQSTTTSLNPLQSRARDTERETDIKAIHAQVEAYWAQVGYYPSLADLNDDSFRAKNLKGLDLGVFKDPGGDSDKLVSSPAKNVYAYAVSNSADKTCEADDTTCAKYVLTATLDQAVNGQQTFVKNSLNY